jgi:CRISPR/Cas system CSM-associated protein Csm5 (group 7 of RAMP superfamily)
MNKITGDKVAAFKSLDTTHDRETSFWNLVDQRIDSLESGLPIEAMNIIRDEFTNTKLSNWDILSDDEKNRQVLWIENEYNNRNKDYDETVMEEPMIREIGEVANRRRQGRIVPMVAPRLDDDDEPMQAG